MKKAKKNSRSTQQDNDGHVKIARMEIELKRNPTNVYTANRLAELKRMHRDKK